MPDVVLDAVHGRRTEDSDDSAETGRRKKRFAGVGIVRPVDKKSKMFEKVVKKIYDGMKHST